MEYKELSQFTALEWGELLKRIRQHVDKTHQEMADLLTVALTTYQKWEWGIRKPQAEYRRRIRDMFADLLWQWDVLERASNLESKVPLSLPQAVLAVAEPPASTSYPEVQESASDWSIDQDAAFQKQAQDPISRLAGLVELPLCPYDEAYLKLQRRCEVIMSDPTRRTMLQGALSILASIPIEGVQRSWQWEPILQRCNVAVAACEELSGSANGADRLLAFNNVSLYIPVLTRIARESSQLHVQALDLAARCAILKTFLGWHCADNTITVGYAKHAVKLGEEAFKASGDPSLWLSAYSKLAWAYFEEDDDDDAFHTACEAQQLLLEQDLKKVPACIYDGTHSTLAVMQAKTEQDPTNALSIAASQDPGDRAIAFMQFTQADRELEAALAYYHAQNYAKARTELERIIDPSTLVLKIPQGESVRGMRLYTIKSLTRTSLMMPDRDIQEIIRFWMAFIEGATTMQSTEFLDRARSLHNEMTIAFPGNKDITDLRSLLPSRTKKAPIA